MITPNIYRDARGFFCETFRQDKFEQFTSITQAFVQDNQSESSYGVLRGLHFQTGQWTQAKLVRVVLGEVLDVVVDLRPDSKTFKKTYSTVLSAKSRKQLFIPRGFAHGFITLSERSVFQYKCDNFYNRDAESGIHYKDATLAIDWHLPESKIKVSPKDLALPFLE